MSTQSFEQVKENLKMLREPIPTALWAEMKMS